MIDELPLDINERRRILKEKGFNISEALLSRTFVVTDAPIYSLNNAFLTVMGFPEEPTFEADEIFVIYKQENILKGTIVPSYILGLDEIRQRQIEKLING